MGTPRLSMSTEFKILFHLLQGKRRKEVARICKVSVSTVAKTKAAWPLLFWRK